MSKDYSNIIFGTRSLLEALDAGKEIEKVMFRKGSVNSEVMEHLRRRVADEHIPFQYVPVEKLNSVTRKNHQGVVAFVSAISYSDIDFILPALFEKGKVPLLLYLDQVSDIRNFGAIARTAEFAGVNAIIIPYRGSALINADAVKTSAGALHRIPVCRVEEPKEAITYLKRSGLEIFAASEKATSNLYDVNLNVPATIIMGSEDKGVSDSLLSLADHEISIPRSGSISSLNVSVAAGILIYEATRQRRIAESS
ncbi:MAG TPA: 23S rRNA (guanosine(2251)-2'-O)-methyltransferase RlmB [Bacteroidales bacterium]|nr:23S rRNA (guanosine(2251)-2'-O)-methyltransferase RlmB [Bacteroidales bacterium]